MTAPMLTEFRHVRQEPGSCRRWFESDGLDLIVWYGATGAVDGFQLCYDSSATEQHALTWRQGVGFAHHRIDGGDTEPNRNESPILLPDGAVPWARLIVLFDVRARTLDHELRELVSNCLAARK